MGRLYRWYSKKRRFRLIKGDISISVVAYDPWLTFKLPEFARGFFRNFINPVLEHLNGKVVFDKKIYKHTIYEVTRFFHFQTYVLFQVIVGKIYYLIRKLFKLKSSFILIKSKRSKAVEQIRLFYFPGSINFLVYENHVPLSFMAFQIDNKTLATSYRDIDFAQVLFNKFKFSGVRVLAWTSNYFLGYPVRIELDTNTNIPLKKLLIATAASIPGYNSGLKIKSFYKESLNKKHCEESFLGNPKAINFSSEQDSDISSPIIVKRTKNSYEYLKISTHKVEEMINDQNVINIIFPIAVLTKENRFSEEWKKTPDKNISGFILGYKNGNPVVISAGSTSLVRMKVNEFLPIILKICKIKKIDFFAYIHTDDGGAVGDFYIDEGEVKKFSPLWGHCFSSMTGFVPVSSEEKVSRQLENWQKL